MAKTKEAVHPHGDHACVCSTCKTEVTVGVGVKCNTQVCAKCGGPMLAKMAGEKRTAEAAGELSADNKRDLLQTAVADKYMVKPEFNPDPTGLYVSEVYDDYLVYRIGEQLYRVSYNLGDDGAVAFEGEPEKVVKQTSYTPMESLQAKYSEIIQEAGKRNANLDSSRIKKIVELCQELLSSDGTDEIKITKTTKEADGVLTWLQEQPIIKIEEGMKYSADSFAYAPDKNNSDTWSLRICENGDTPIKALLAKASASLSPGGYRGIKANIPASALTEVKHRLRTEYRNLGTEVDDMPKWVKESETREEVIDYTPLTEAKFDRGRATVIVIKPGFNSSEDRYYPMEMLKRDYSVFEGMKMYADHPTVAEDKALPERSVKSTGWVAVLKDVTCDEAGIVTGIAEIVEPWLMTKLATLRDKQLLSEMGISINAVGKAIESTVGNKKTLVIEKLIACRSVDFVTEPGAGGIVTFYESDKSRDVDLIELSGLQEKRPDLVKLIEANLRAEIQQEVKNKVELEEKVKELEGQVAGLTTERDGLKEAADKAEKDKVIAEAQASIKEAVDKAELPDIAKERVIEKFKSAESADGVAEAIQAEKDYIAKLSESSTVKGMGSPKVDPKASYEKLVEGFKALGMSDTEAEIAAKG